jgi:hypothetical protein
MTMRMLTGAQEYRCLSDGAEVPPSREMTLHQFMIASLLLCAGIVLVKTRHDLRAAGSEREERHKSHRTRWVPVVALSSLCLLTAAALTAFWMAAHQNMPAAAPDDGAAVLPPSAIIPLASQATRIDDAVQQAQHALGAVEMQESPALRRTNREGTPAASPLISERLDEIARSLTELKQIIAELKLKTEDVERVLNGDPSAKVSSITLIQSQVNDLKAFNLAFFVALLVSIAGNLLPTLRRVKHRSAIATAASAAGEPVMENKPG